MRQSASMVFMIRHSRSEGRTSSRICAHSQVSKPDNFREGCHSWFLKDTIIRDKSISLFANLIL